MKNPNKNATKIITYPVLSRFENISFFSCICKGGVVIIYRWWLCVVIIGFVIDYVHHYVLLIHHCLLFMNSSGLYSIGVPTSASIYKKSIYFFKLIITHLSSSSSSEYSSSSSVSSTTNPFKFPFHHIFITGVGFVFVVCTKIFIVCL